MPADGDLTLLPIDGFVSRVRKSKPEPAPMHLCVGYPRPRHDSGLVLKHQGPGPHASGSSQKVHGGGDGATGSTVEDLQRALPWVKIDLSLYDQFANALASKGVDVETMKRAHIDAITSFAKEYPTAAKYITRIETYSDRDGAGASVRMDEDHLGLIVQANVLELGDTLAKFDEIPQGSTLATTGRPDDYQLIREILTHEMGHVFHFAFTRDVAVREMPNADERTTSEVAWRGTFDTAPARDATGPFVSSTLPGAWISRYAEVGSLGERFAESFLLARSPEAANRWIESRPEGREQAEQAVLAVRRYIDSIDDDLVEKHVAGLHDQKRHGNRAGADPRIGNGRFTTEQLTTWAVLDWVNTVDIEQVALPDASMADVTYLTKHQGPGPHQNGSPQAIHAGAGSWAISNTRATGGVSVSFHRGGTRVPGGTSKVVSPYPDRSKAVPSDALTNDVVSSYIEANQNALKKPDHYLGLWRDPSDGTVYIDVSIVVRTHEEARRIALEHDQIAYFDMETMSDVVVNQEATSGQGSGVEKGARGGLGPVQRGRDGERGDLRGDRGSGAGADRGDAGRWRVEDAVIKHGNGTHDEKTHGRRGSALNPDGSLATGSNVYWRWHDDRRAFSPGDATSSSFLWSGRGSTATPRAQGEVRAGYSAFNNPWHLLDYMRSMDWKITNGHVVRFEGERVGEGHDGEDLVMPSTDDVARIHIEDFAAALRSTPMGDKPTWQPETQKYTATIADSDWNAEAMLRNTFQSGSPFIGMPMGRVITNLHERVTFQPVAKHLPGVHDQESHGNWASANRVKHTSLPRTSQINYDDLPPKFREALDRRAKTLGITMKGLETAVASLLDRGELAHGDWYEYVHHAATHMAKDNDTTVEKVAALMSIMSRDREFNKSLRDVEKLLQAHKKNPVVTITKEIVDEYEAFRQSKIERGRPVGPPAPKPGKYRLSELDVTHAIALTDLVHLGNRTGLGDPILSLAVLRGASIDDAIDGPKLRSFFNNIVDPHGDAVTVDRWMYRAMFSKRKTFPRNGERHTIDRIEHGDPNRPRVDPRTGQVKYQGATGINTFFQSSPGALVGTGIPSNVGMYPMFAEAVRRVARRRNIAPAAAQAIIWEVARRDAGFRPTDPVRVLGPWLGGDAPAWVQAPTVLNDEIGE